MRIVFVFVLILVSILLKAQIRAIPVKGNWVALNDDGSWRWVIIEDNGTWKYADSLRSQHEIDSVSTLEYDMWNSGLTFRLQTGVWIPLGKLSNTFRPAPALGFSIGIPFLKKFRFDFGFSYANQVNNSREFNYLLSDTTLKTKSPSVASIGLQLTRVIEFKRRAVFDFLDIHAGLSASIIDTNLKKPDSNEADETRTVETICLSSGFTLRRKVLKKRSLGLNFRYDFTPQRLFSKNVEQGFGNSSLSVGIEYRY